jgi:hypothetical protein
LFQRGKGNIVLAYKIFVYKGESSGSSVKQGIGLNCLILKGNGTRNYQVFSFKLTDANIRNRETRLKDLDIRNRKTRAGQLKRRRGERAVARASSEATAYSFPDTDESTEDEAEEETGVTKPGAAGWAVGT